MSPFATWKTVAIGVLIIWCANAQGEQALFGGVWVNPHQDTRSMTRVVITEEDGRLQIQAWGRCHPEDCDWGVVDLHLVSPSVDSKDYAHAFARWDHRHMNAYWTLKMENDQLFIEMITVFKGRIASSNYRSVVLLQRSAL